MLRQWRGLVGKAARSYAIRTEMGKTRKNFYAVRVGREVGVYRTWEECEAQVKKYPGAVFKGFHGMEEAQAFVHSSPATHARNSYSGTRNSYSGTRNSYSGRFSGSSSARQHYRHTAGQYSHSRVITPTEAHVYSTKIVARCRALSVQTNNEQGLPTVYSDGCCINNGKVDARAGVGVYWGENHPHNVSERLVGLQTNQRAELVSAYKAIQSAIDQGYSAVEVKTDSTYTIKVVTEWIDTWKKNGWQTAKAKAVKNKEDIMRLDSICQRINVKWTHVPGHRGVAGNEAADQLAKAGSQM